MVDGGGVDYYKWCFFVVGEGFDVIECFSVVVIGDVGVGGFGYG